MFLPEMFVKEMKDILNSEYENFEKSLEQSSEQGIRLNRLRFKDQSFFLKLKEELGLFPVPWCSDGYYVEHSSPGNLIYYDLGLYYCQDPSAMLTVAALEIDPGDRVLDLCAAPGGKSSYVASKLNNTGFLLSNDVDLKRIGALKKNLDLQGVKNVSVTMLMPKQLSPLYPSFFDKIIVDAPCSGSGMFRKDKNAIKAFGTKPKGYYEKIQREILNEADIMLADGGVIAYSTCTFGLSENENIIEDFLESHKNYSIVNLDCESLGISHAYKFGSARIFPHRQRGEGHFLALLKKNGEAINCEARFSSFRTSSKSNECKLVYDFYEQFLNLAKPKVYIRGSGVFADVDYGLDNALRPGFFIGELGKSGFSPSQALAMSLTPDDAKNTMEFEFGDERVVRYRRGESFDLDEPYPDGWYLFCVSGFSMGWVKVSGGRAKNKYPKAWVR